MDKGYEALYHQVETKHWWFKGRRNAILSLLQSASRNSKVLDIGCSSGILLHDLKDAGFKDTNLYGVDISEEAIQNCHSSGLSQTYVMNAQQIELPKNQFDILIASDCLEHLSEDEQALKNWFSLLKEGGKLYIFVPAFMFLWSAHDEVNHHYRRYNLQELEQKLKAAGFAIEKAGYWNALLFLPVAVVRTISNSLRSLLGKKEAGVTGDITMPPQAVNKLLLQLLKVENNLLNKLSFPAGVSTFCVARKNSKEN